MALEQEKKAAIHKKIKEILALNRKERKLCEIARAICKKLYTANLRKIKKIESILKTKPTQQLKLKLEKLKADNEMIKALIATFSNFDSSINTEIGWLTNEAGALTKPEVVKKAMKEEAACIKKQEALVAEMKKQIEGLFYMPSKTKTATAVAKS